MPTDPPDPDDLDGLIERIADGKPVGALSPGAGVAARRAHALAALLDGVAHAARAEVAPPPRPSPRSAMLGPFRLLEMIGEGGMGEVWMAERCDGQVEQRVAIKRVRGAARLSMLRHLLRERRILARLNHPNIAHFLGADVDGEGEPYLVLEFVEGIPLDRWCREHQPTLEQRLCMFLAICGAVEHAHRHLVVHRDLKPANVLVTADGTPKLLDFGIARLLEDSTSGQTTGPPAMTPRYAAPEQFSGDDVTAAVDQYALGLLLHELLTGELPQARSDGNLAKIAAAFGDGDPPAASSTMSAQGNGPVSVAMVRGDLDAIIARCLRADPLTRYASVGALAADLRLHLEGRPVAARGDARGYRLRRFAARHRLAIAMACMALAAILAALFGALFQADRAMREAAAAAAARDSAEAMSKFLSDVISAPADAGLGANVRVVDLLDSAERRLSGESHITTAQRLALHHLLARSYSSLGRDARAVASARSGLALAGEDQEHRRARIALLQVLGQTEAVNCNLEPARRAAEQLRREAELAQADIDVAEAALIHARIAECSGDYARQRSESGRALELARDIPEAIDTFSRAAEQNARAAFALGDATLAHAILQDALSKWTGHEGNITYGWIDLRHQLLQVTAALGDLEQAEQIARDSLERMESNHGARPHPATLATRSALAGILLDRGSYASALEMNDMAFAEATALYGADGSESLQILANRANALKALGRHDEAEESYRRVIEALHKAEGATGQTEARLIHTFNLLELLNERRRYAEAATLGRTLLEEATRQLGPNHLVVLETRDAIGVTALGLGDAAGAIAHHREALNLKRASLGENSPFTITARHRLGLALAADGQEALARIELSTALVTSRAILGAEHADTQAIEKALASLAQ